MSDERENIIQLFILPSFKVRRHPLLRPHWPFSCHCVCATRFVCLCSRRPGPDFSRMGVCPRTGCVPMYGIKGGLAWRDAEREREILICALHHECSYLLFDSLLLSQLN